DGNESDATATDREPGVTAPLGDAPATAARVVVEGHDPKLPARRCGCGTRFCGSAPPRVTEDATHPLAHGWWRLVVRTGCHLTRHALDGIHHLVGGLAPGAPRVGTTVRAQIERRAELHGDLR